MTPERFNELLERKLADTRSVLAGKADEYAHGGDRLSNFKRAAGLLNCTPESALLGFVTKHITALYDFVAELEAGRCMTLEQWAEKTGDIRNYMLLLDALVEERLSAAPSEAEPPPHALAYSEDDNFILEAALQHGFTILDDDATMFQCNQLGLVSLVNAYRGHPCP